MKARLLICAVLALVCAASFCGCSRRVHPSYHHTNHHTNYDTDYDTDYASPEPQVNQKKNSGSGNALVNSCAVITTAAFALLAASGKDAQLSSYAVKRTPIYGSRDRALRASNVLEYLSVGIAVLVYTAKYFPVVDAVIDYPVSISTAYPPGDAHQYAAIDAPLAAVAAPTAIGVGKALALSGAATSAVTELLKKQALRPRPDRSDTLSFPSGHATAAACANQASARMISGLGLPPHCAYPAYAALSLLTLGTAWGRVEGGRHYPGDVMAGMYVGIAFTDAPFVLYGGDDNALGVRFGINTYNERGSTTTVLSTTVDF